MKNDLITLAIMLLLSFVSFSQIKYEKGYFISNDGTKTECLIKNIEWRYNPTEFLYKLSENDIPKIAKISAVKEFEIIGESKYERHNVEIDISTTELDKLDNIRKPKWKTKTVFLKLLVEGDTDLYQYLIGNNFKYFFKTSDDSKIKQLIFKKYLTQRGDIAKNLTYINQLYKKVNCKDLAIDKIKSVDYNQIALTKYFEKENFCKNPDLKNITKHKRNKGKFNFKITPGVNFSSFSITNILSESQFSYNFDSKTNIRIGAEIEYVLPFNKNKWSVFTDSNYYSYLGSSEKEFETTVGTILHTVKADATIKRLAVSIGIRHYFFLNDNIKVFLNGGFSYDKDLGSSVVFDTRRDLKMESSSYNTFGGIGTNINNRYSIEIRYFSPDHLGINYLYWYSKFNTISLILGYNFL